MPKCMYILSYNLNYRTTLVKTKIIEPDGVTKILTHVL